MKKNTLLVRDLQIVFFLQYISLQFFFSRLVKKIQFACVLIVLLQKYCATFCIHTEAVVFLIAPDLISNSNTYTKKKCSNINNNCLDKL